MLNGITVGIFLILIFLFAGLMLTLLIGVFLPPVFSTPKKIVGEILQIMNLNNQDVLIDLGSGNGNFLLSAHTQSQCKCLGYDISPIMLIIANTKKILRFPTSKDISFDTEDVFSVDISNATKIYCYLDEKSMNILKPKLEEFVNKGGKVFSYMYPIDGIEGKRVDLSNEKCLWLY